MAVATLGALLILFAGGLAASALAYGGALLVCGLLAGRYAAKAGSAAADDTAAGYLAAAAAPQPEGIAGPDRLCENVLPVWTGQIGTARSRTEEAITALSGRFSGISGKLEAVAVVADEVRKLSTLSGETGKRIAEKVESVNAAIATTINAADQYARLDKETLQGAESAVNDVLDQFRGAASGLTESAAKRRAVAGR